MKKHSLLLPLLCANFFCFGQRGEELDLTAITDSITIEGKQMYRSEMASWYGTDIFLAVYKDRAKIGGYLSYLDKDTARCIFFSKGENPVVIGTISFDESYNTNRTVADYTERIFTEKEMALYSIRTKALDIINTGDSLFKFYKKTNYNLIPLISNGQKKVYVLTEPEESGVVIFGNDYLLTFNEKNELIVKKQLHKNILFMDYGDKVKNGEKAVGGVHTHLPETGEFMTATDICTLLLYSKFARWEQHMVVSAHYMNIWNCKTNKLIAIPRETIDKINNDRKSKKD